MRYIYLLICSLLFSSINFAQQPIDSTRTDSTQVDSLILKRNMELQPNIVEPPGGCVISGPTTVTAGQLYTYTVNCSVINPSWSALNGITSNSTPNSVTVKWGLIVNLQSDTTAAPLNDVSTSNTTSNNINFIPPPSELGQLILKSNGTETGTSLTVYIHEPPPSPFSPGTIAPAQQTVGAGNAAATLNWTSISPGDGTPFTFQWQKSTDSANWTNISGATSMNYSPGVLTAKTYFRAQVGQSSLVDYTNVAVVNINSPLTPGVISPTTQTIAYNTSPGVLHCTAATGGTNTYVYQWQSSLNNSTWSNVSGATALTYTPGALTAKTYYRVRIIQGSTTVYSNVSIITVNPPSPTDHVPNVVTALPANQNYIATWTATAPITDPAILITRPLSDVKLTVQYFDGLGRPLQIVAKQGSLITATLTSADLVSMPLYDGFGRDTGALLPYPASDAANGSYRPDAQSKQLIWYNSGSSPVTGQGEIGINAHSLNVYENSPLDRVLESYGPGGSWVGSSKQPLENNRHGVKQKYWINTIKDSVEIFDFDMPTTLGNLITPVSKNRYQAGQLYKNVSVDETGKQVIEFKDKEGHTVLKKAQLTATADNGTGSGHAGWLCTYYIYDDLGNLRCVVQPEGVKALQTAGWVFSSNMLSEQCFRYEYDGRNRMVIKQVPGAAAVYMVYDNRDRLVMTQDGNMRTPHKWLATKYDDLNRPSISWQYTDASGSSLKTILEAAAAASVYPNVTPAASTILTETHYDDYTGITLPTGMSASFIGTWNAYWLTASITAFPYAEQPAKNTQITTKGLVTWTKTAILDSTNGFLLSLTIYDDKGRVIQTQQQNITGGIDVTSTQYSWAGQPLVVVSSQQAKKGAAVQTTVSVTKMSYDDLGRLVKTEQRQSNSKVGTGAMSNYATISQIGYDALGQVKRKELGKRRSTASLYTNTPLETQDYDYNIRGWLLGVNRDYARSKAYTDSANTATLTTQTFSGEMFTESSMDIQSVTFLSHNYFGFDLGYDKPNNNLIGGKTYTAPQYNGNITGMVWKDAHDSKVRKYDYTYDAASRLTGANFGQYTASNFTATKVNYSVSGLTYDENGNIKKLVRSGLLTAGTSATIDNLAYAYQPGTNKLSTVTDAILNNAGEKLGDFQDGNISGADYSYDANGNMTIDKNKKITQIVYNILNLPREIRVDGTAGKGTIRYYYDATGNKLRKVTIDSTTLPAKQTVTTYIGGSVYQNDTLQFFGTSEGRARPNATDSFFVYDYFLKDHLGNTRMMITDDYNVSSPILETSSYYPFGLTQKGISNANSVLHQQNKYLYNGKELQQEFGLDQYDYGARFYDPQIGVWHTQDPLTEASRRWSPYNYAYDNPIRFIDKDGMRVDTVIQRETILQFENPRFNGAFFYRYDRFINSIIANQSDADIDADGSNSSDAKKDKTHQNTNAAGIDPDEINGYVLPTSDFKVEKDGRSRKSKESTEIGKANRKAFSSNGVRHKDVALMYNLDNEKSAFGIYVEGGPNNKSGEITPAAARQLEIPDDPNSGGMSQNKLLIVIFPGSSKDFGGKTPTQRMINQIGTKYFQQNKQLINKAINDTKKIPNQNPYD